MSDLSIEKGKAHFRFDGEQKTINHMNDFWTFMILFLRGSGFYHATGVNSQKDWQQSCLEIIQKTFFNVG